MKRMVVFYTGVGLSIGTQEEIPDFERSYTIIQVKTSGNDFLSLEKEIRETLYKYDDGVQTIYLFDNVDFEDLTNIWVSNLMLQNLPVLVQKDGDLYYFSARKEWIPTFELYRYRLSKKL